MRGDLRPVYTAPSEVVARERFAEFDAKWGKQYPAISKLWEIAWGEFIPFLDERRRDPVRDLQHERDRVAQRALPSRCQSPRTLP
jgi:hypothetical protein